MQDGDIVLRLGLRYQVVRVLDWEVVDVVRRGGTVGRGAVVVARRDGDVRDRSFALVVDHMARREHLVGCDQHARAEPFHTVEDTGDLTTVSYGYVVVEVKLMQRSPRTRNGRSAGGAPGTAYARRAARSALSDAPRAYSPSEE